MCSVIAAGVSSGFLFSAGDAENGSTMKRCKIASSAGAPGPVRRVPPGDHMGAACGLAAAPSGGAAGAAGGGVRGG